MKQNRCKTALDNAKAACKNKAQSAQNNEVIEKAVEDTKKEAIRKFIKSR